MIGFCIRSRGIPRVVFEAFVDTMFAECLECWAYGARFAILDVYSIAQKGKFAISNKVKFN